MYGIFTYIYHKNQPNVGKYTIHGWYGIFFKRFKLHTLSQHGSKMDHENSTHLQEIFEKAEKHCSVHLKNWRECLMETGMLQNYGSVHDISTVSIYLSIYLSFVLFPSILFHSIVYTSLPEIVHWQFRQILKNSIGRPFQTLPTLP